jgi:hypothetical protein
MGFSILWNAQFRGYLLWRPPLRNVIDIGESDGIINFRFVLIRVEKVGVHQE